MESKLSTPSVTGAFGSGLRPERRKLAALITSIALLSLFGYLSWRQPSPGQLDPPPVFPSLKWFRYPYEVNPENRPPTYPPNWFWYPLAVKPEERSPAEYTELGRIAVVPDSNGRTLVTAGYDGTILRTVDGGSSWTVEKGWTSEDNFLVSVTFTDFMTGWAVGQNGTILHTEDGGLSWTVETSGTLRKLYGVAFTDSRTGWAVGQNGTILHTGDGGLSWTTKKTGTTAGLDSVAFTDSRTGWAAGETGTILHTEDGGLNWTTEKSGTVRELYRVIFVDSRAGWVVGENGTILHTEDGGLNWTVERSGTTQDLMDEAFMDLRTGWAVGDHGTILHTVDGGSNWAVESSGTPALLNGVTFTDVRTGWAVGDSGTILRTEDGGNSWSPAEAFRYRRYPAPWFYLATLSLLPLFIWSLVPITVTSTTIQDSITADAPVESLDDDKLDQRPLVERLSGFLQNPNTLPPLVISLQAQWGMGKSTVMRMLQSNLERNRAAITVWFNAWHHQTEDQLLAYLLETIQKEVVPQWLSRKGVPFRVNLLRVRLFSWKQIDRLALVLAGVALIVIQRAQPGWLSAVPYRQLWLPYAAPFLAALPILEALIAFKSNPEKLTDKSGGFLVDTFKELIRLPSLVGKSDVRQEFASNLRDVVTALKPQRLVIFLDDLDRCRPEQVVQILESINFLSSVAQCFLIVGADYDKVETLVANQFETLALREEENRTRASKRLDAVELRVRYARNYLKKIVNLRLNLHRPMGYASFLAGGSASNQKGSKLLPVAGIFATVAVLAVLFWSLTLQPQNPELSAKPATAAVKAGGEPIPQPQATSGVLSSAIPAPQVQDKKTAPKSAPARVPQDGGTLRNLLSIGIPLLLVVGGSFYWFNLPRQIEEARDADTFTQALEKYSEQIFKKYESPREARRFLNYLRLVATSSGQKEKDALKNLRIKYPDRFDLDLVSLAVLDGADSVGDDSEVKQYYKEQCGIFGLDEKTFQPRENGIGHIKS